jgi:peptide/nickel transport system permease protein
MTQVALEHPGEAPVDGLQPELRGKLRGNSFVWFLAKRLVGALLTLAVVSALIFLALRVVPGDVARTVLGRGASQQAVDHLRSQLGLDRPLVVQYGDWIGGVLQGDLGDSTTALARDNQDPSVWSAIGTPLLNSGYLAAITGILLVPLGMLLGTWAAVRERKVADSLISTISLALGSMPEFLIGTLLVSVFFTWLKLLPPIVNINPGQTPLSHPDALVLPVATLLAVSLSFTVRMVRAGTVEALQQDYVGMARLNGVKERRVVFRYALRNALAPSIQAIAQTVAYLAGGIVITESVFNYPGIGRELVQTVSERDLTTTADITLILAAFYVVINVVSDFVVVLIVPKLRTSL